MIEQSKACFRLSQPETPVRDGVLDLYGVFENPSLTRRVAKIGFISALFPGYQRAGLSLGFFCSVLEWWRIRWN
jgi:hypothetical protein